MRWLLVCFGAAALGQGPPITREALEVLDLARLAGPEFFADTYYRVLGSRRVLSLSAEKQLLLEVFDRAEDIRALQPVMAAWPGLSSERSRVLIQSQRFQLDRLSLQCLVVTRLLAIQESRKARELFERITLPPPARPECTETIVPVRTIYWETLPRVVLQNDAFTAIERERDIPVQLAEDRLRTIATATDLGPAALAVRTIMAQRDPRGRLITALGGAYASVQDTDRSFTFAITNLGAVENAITLAEEARGRRLPVAGLLACLRGFLLRHYQGARCSDTIAPPSSTPRALRTNNLLLPVEMFNLRATPLSSQLDPILDPDRRPGSVDTKVPTASPSLRLQFDAFATLLDQLAAGREDRDRFNDLADQCRRALADWRETSEVYGAEYFHQKAVSSRGYIRILPTGDRIRPALNEHIRIMLATTVKRDSPAEWLYHVESLLALTRRPPEPQDRRDRKASAPPAPAHEASYLIIEALTESYDPALHLYGRLEQLFPRPRVD